MRPLFFLVIFTLVFSSFASAQELQEKFHDWSLFKAKRGDKEVCYLMSLPIKQQSKNRVGEPFFVVTGIENDADEISVSSGVYYNPSSDVELSFDAKKFYLFPHQTFSWADDVNDDLEIIKQMQREIDMTVIAVSQQGDVVTDTYSLIGFSKAYRKLKQGCK